ncbi:MAG: hypothetical protein L3J03_09570 [Desulfobacterales bacterium]|nr:hypothetical protein [Desulfobacterales bacterium]
MQALLETVRTNCAISDARDNGVFSLCILVLKLRNLYKWETGLDPWDEPESGILLDWIDAKERSWEGHGHKSFLALPVDSARLDPFATREANLSLGRHGLVYGAGYGRSLKAIFFIAERVAERKINGCRAVILGREKARELSAPFAMTRDNTIYFRQEPFRFYLWDQIQEMRPSGREGLLFALGHYGFLDQDNSLDPARLRQGFDLLVKEEMETYLRHEVGEMQPGPLPGATLKKIIAAFPASPVELLARGLKDILADTHPKGMLGYIIANRREASLGFYASFLDGLRKKLFIEIRPACRSFIKNRDWREIDTARQSCRQRIQGHATRLASLAGEIDTTPADEMKERIRREFLCPLGLTNR